MNKLNLHSLIVVTFFIGFLAGFGVDVDNSDTPPIWVAFFTFFMWPFIYVLIIFSKDLMPDGLDTNSKKCLFHPFKCPDKFYLVVGCVIVASSIGMISNTIITERSLSFEGVFFLGGGISCLLGRYLGIRKRVKK